METLVFVLGCSVAVLAFVFEYIRFKHEQERLNKIFDREKEQK